MEAARALQHRVGDVAPSGEALLLAAGRLLAKIEAARAKQDHQHETFQEPSLAKIDVVKAKKDQQQQPQQPVQELAASPSRIVLAKGSPATSGWGQAALPAVDIPIYLPAPRARIEPAALGPGATRAAPPSTGTTAAALGVAEERGLSCQERPFSFGASSIVSLALSLAHCLPLSDSTVCL